MASRRVLICALAADVGWAFACDDLAIDSHRLDILARGDLKHHVEHHFFENRAESASPGATADSLLGKGAKSIARDAQFHVVHGELLAVLLDESVFRLGENRHQLIFRQLAE